jgi:hypothetical protein
LKTNYLATLLETLQRWQHPGANPAKIFNVICSIGVGNNYFRKKFLTLGNKLLP